MSKERLYIGKSGEDRAVCFLKENGYRIVERNYKTKLGEIDIIARDRDTYVFIEVKTRNSLKFGLPQEAVSRPKQRQISKAALNFLKVNNLFAKKARFDVVCVQQEGQPIALLKNAFELSSDFIY